MLEKAKQKKSLKDCSFLEEEFTMFNTNKKYDLITSFFAFGSSSYFSDEEMIDGLKKVKNMLEEGGIFLCLGVSNLPILEEQLKPLHAGEITLKKGLTAIYFIGKKK